VVEMEKLLLSPEEAAEVLGVTRSTIYDLMRMRILTSVKIGRRRLVPVKACEEMVDRMVEESA
jgi:excisionase family DNA binding protein